MRDWTGIRSFVTDSKDTITWSTNADRQGPGIPGIGFLSVKPTPDRPGIPRRSNIVKAVCGQQKSVLDVPMSGRDPQSVLDVALQR